MEDRAWEGNISMDMKNRQIKKAPAAVAALCVFAALIAGCELDDDPVNSVTISPDSALLEAKNTNIVEFTAVGGDNSYKWSMNNDTLGMLYVATTSTATVLYQNSTNIGTNIITVRDASGDSANARIVQK